MLTRRQAKDNPCKPNDALLSLVGVIVAAHGAGAPQDELASVMAMIPMMGKCIAEKCPMWVDLNGDGDITPFCGKGVSVGQHRSCTVSQSCNLCEHRYGRCGG